MSNILFVSSVIAAVIWGVCFVLIESNQFIHVFLIAAFLGTVVSVYLDEKQQVSKR